MMKLVWPVLLSGLSLNAVAQTAGVDEAAPDEGPPRWSVGLAAVVSESPYAGEGTRVVPIPLVMYHGEKFYFRGISAGWRFVENDSFELSAMVKPRLDGFKVKDLGRAELARNGIDWRKLDDRKTGLDAGLGMKWSGKAGELEIEVLADVTDKSGGQEVSIDYGYPMEFGEGTVTTGAGITWMSKDSANYNFGTLAAEVARGVADYKPGAVTLPHVGVSYVGPLGEKWSMMASFKFTSLPDEIKKSPFVERGTDSASTFFVGFSRGF